MGGETIAILVVAGLVTIIVIAIRERKRSQWDARENRPPLLRVSRLEMSERPLSGRHPPLRGRVDQVYRTPSGELVLVETKSRSRVYAPDIVQVSAYAAMLEDQGHRVAGTGYVRCAPPSGDVFYQPVQLLDNGELVQLYQRRQSLLAGAPPRKAAHAGICRNCVYLEECGGVK